MLAESKSSETGPDVVVSVVIPVLNGERVLPTQLDALRSQDSVVPWEVIVADNGSTDRTAEVVSRAAQDFPVPLRLVDASSRRGISHARNVGIVASSGSLIAFCDGDDRVDEFWVQEAFNALRENQIVAGLNRILTSPFRRDTDPVNPGCVIPTKLGGNVLMSGNSAARKETLLELGGFDESLPRYGFEDTDFAIRAYKAGIPIAPAPNMIIYYRPSNGRTSVTKAYLSSKAEAVLWARHPDRFRGALKLRTLGGQVVEWPLALARATLTDRSHIGGTLRDGLTRVARLHAALEMTWSGPGQPRLLNDRESLPTAQPSPTLQHQHTALWVVPVSDLAGVARHVIDVARVGLPGWRLVVAAPEGPLLQKLRELGTEVVPIATGFGTAAALQALRAAVHRIGPRIVHSHLAKADLFVAAATVGQPVKLISTEHHISPDRYMFHPNHAEARLMEAAHHVRLARFSRVIAVSASTRRDMLARWRTRTPIDVILNGVDRPDPAPEREPGLRFLSLTRLSAEKNVEMTLRVFALILAEHPEATLTIAGQGPELRRLEGMADHLGITDTVTFPGFVDAAEAMAGHDVILQPSRSDNCSYTLLDAAAQGMGVAASPIGGNPEILPMRCIAALDDDVEFARVAVEQALDLSARPVLGPHVPTVTQMAERIVAEYDAALGKAAVTRRPEAGIRAGIDRPAPEHAGATATAPEVSVVIPYFKAAEWLPVQLNALAGQVDPPAFEVIIADNEGSTQLPEVSEPFYERLDLRIVDATARRGAAFARNCGVAAARGRFVAFCDADDIVGPAWLAALTESLRNDDLLATGPLRLDRVNSEAVWRTTMGATSHQDVSRPVLQQPFTYLGYLPFAYSCNIGMRRSTFLDLGGFDESFTRGDEDVDLSWRAAEHGVRTQKVPEAIIDYRQRSTATEVWRQRHNYQRSQVEMWMRSRRLNRPVSGMSVRWTLTETLKLFPQGLRALTANEAERYSFSAHAGDILGNLQGQWEQRIVKRRTPRHQPHQGLMPLINKDLKGEDPEVSVIIPFYRDDDTLREQLHALTGQMNCPIFEVIVADNEGSDNLRTIISPFRTDLNIRVVDAYRRRGAAHARNIAAGSANASILAFCDADDVVEEHWLSAISAPLFNESVHVTGPMRMDKLNQAHQWRVFTGTPSGAEENPILLFPYPLLGYLPFAPAGNMAILRSRFLELGGFNESLDTGSEDVDLSWRASEHDTPLRVAHDAIVDYRLRMEARDVYTQRRNMARGEVAIWQMSRREHRPVRGMSLRWTLTETMKLLPQGLHALNDGEAERYSFAAHAGDLIGNLQGQMEQRVRPRLKQLMSQALRRDRA